MYCDHFDNVQTDTSFFHFIWQEKQILNGSIPCLRCTWPSSRLCLKSRASRPAWDAVKCKSVCHWVHAYLIPPWQLHHELTFDLICHANCLNKDPLTYVNMNQSLRIRTTGNLTPIWLSPHLTLVQMILIQGFSTASNKHLLSFGPTFKSTWIFFHFSVHFTFWEVVKNHKESPMSFICNHKHDKEFPQYSQVLIPSIQWLYFPESTGSVSQC